MNGAAASPPLGPTCRKRLALAGVALVAVAGGTALFFKAREPAPKPEPKAAPKPSATSGSDTGAPAPAVLALRDAVNLGWPQRGKASDGIMGDASHQARKSDHNQGNAIDITHDATHGPNLDELAEVVFRDPRVTYVIWHDRIRNKAIAGGAWRPYCEGKPGCNPHTGHLHVSIDAAKRNDASPWDVGRGVA